MQKIHPLGEFFALIVKQANSYSFLTHQGCAICCMFFLNNILMFQLKFCNIHLMFGRKAWLQREDIVDALFLLRVEKAVPLLVRMFVDENRNRIDRGIFFMP